MTTDVTAEVAETERLAGLITLDELTNRVGISVRNVRFYASKGLVPPPIRRGRSGYYTADHVARLELVQELQSHGFTLAAIEKYVAGIPADATAEEIALRRTMLAPWHAPDDQVMTLAELEGRADRQLSEIQLETLVALGIIERQDDDSFRVVLSHLTVGLSLLDLDFPPEAARAAAEVYQRAGREVAVELDRLFRKIVWPAYQQQGTSADTLREVVERLKPLSIASLVAAYEMGMDETKRESLESRAYHP